MIIVCWLALPHQMQTKLDKNNLLATRKFAIIYLLLDCPKEDISSDKM